MIRDEIKEKIEELNLGFKWSIKQHCNCVSYETLEVNANGTLDEREEPSSNSWHAGTYVLTHTYGNIPCNCDWCAEWEHNENNVQKEFECKSDFIEACLDNNDGGGNLKDYIFEKIDEIPYGFFEDEKK